MAASWGRAWGGGGEKSDAVLPRAESTSIHHESAQSHFFLFFCTNLLICLSAMGTSDSKICVLKNKWNLCIWIFFVEHFTQLNNNF